MSFLNIRAYICDHREVGGTEIFVSHEMRKGNEKRRFSSGYLGDNGGQIEAINDKKKAFVFSKD